MGNSFVTTNVSAEDLAAITKLAGRSGWFHQRLSKNLRDLRRDVLIDEHEISSAAQRAEQGLNIRAGREVMVGTVHPTEDPDQPSAGITPWRAKYFDLLLPHPEAHEAVEDVLAPYVESAATALVNRDGRPGMPRSFKAFSERVCLEAGTEVVARPVPFGVSALLVARSGDSVRGLVTARTRQVAINPGVITTAIDGGLSAAKSPLEQVAAEAADELRGAVDVKELLEVEDALKLVGLLVPGDEPLPLTGDTRVCRTGVGAIYLVEVTDEQLDATLERAARAIDDKNQFIEGHPTIIDLETLLLHPPGPLAEPLVAAAGLALGADRAKAQFGIDIRDTPVRARENKETHMADADSRRGSRSGDDSTGKNGNQRFAEAMIRRFPHLDRRCKSLEDFQENSVTTNDDLDFVEAARQLLEVLIEYRHVSEDELGYFDRGRLYEALVYEVHRTVFNGRLDDAKRMVAIFASGDYADHLDFDIRAGSANYAKSTAVSPIPVESAHPDWPRRDFIARAEEDGLTSVETEQLRAAIHRLAFCCTIVEMESLETPEAAGYVLNRENRSPLSGDPMALFFKARGMFISPVLSGAQLMTGFQYALAALERYGRQAGFHHVVALFELRLAAAESSAESRDQRINSALARVDRSIELDPEVSDLYVTRARVKKLMGRPMDARVDLEAAIELERFVSEGRTDENERMKELKSQLEVIGQ